MQLPFNKKNIYLILGGIAVIFFGYILMATEDFIDATEFSLSLYVSPVLIILGHVVVAWGIIAGAQKPAEMEAGESGDQA